MAARSEGIFPREGFNLDNSFKITNSPVAAPVTLANVRSLRVVVIGGVYTAPTGDGTDSTLTIDIGGKTVDLSGAQIEAAMEGSGVFMIHFRGFGCPNNNVQYSNAAGSPNTGTAGTFTFADMYVELVDGPAF